MREKDFYGWGEILMENLPTYWEEDDFMQQFLMAVGFEFDPIGRFVRFMTDAEIYGAIGQQLTTNLEPMHSAWFVRTANEAAMAYWEQMFSSPIDASSTLPERRANIITRMQGTATPTPAYIHSQIAQYADEIAVVEYFDLPPDDLRRYSFSIRIIKPKGFPPNVQSNINLMIKRIKPSHLGYFIEYSEVTWHGDTSNMTDRTWADLGNVTWADLRFE
jgi:Bacteriophage Mu-like, Gp48